MLLLLELFHFIFCPVPHGLIMASHPDEVTHLHLIKKMMKIGYVDVYSAVTSLLVTVLFEL